MEGIINAGRRYFNVANGLMTERVNGQNRAINYLSEVYLVRVDIKEIYKGTDPDKKYVGSQLQLHFISHTDYYILCMWQNSRAAKCFYSIMESIDLRKQCTIRTSMWEDNGKKKDSISIKQDGAFLKWNHTKENPNGLPPMVQNGATGKWEDREQMEFYLQKLKNVLVPRLEWLPNPIPHHPIFSGYTKNELAGGSFAEQKAVAHISKGPALPSDAPNYTVNDDPDDLPF